MTNQINRSEEKLRGKIEADEKRVEDIKKGIIRVEDPQEEIDYIQENLMYGYDALSEYDISGRCDQCGRFTSVRTHGNFYHATGGRTEPEEPSELYCPRCDRKNRAYQKKHS